MFRVTYASMVIFISIIWCLIRAAHAVKNKGIKWVRELQLLLVYICIIVVSRFTFFPFGKINGEIQALVYDSRYAYPFRINTVPFVNIFDYPTFGAMFINVIGNIIMFVPLGIVWPYAYKELDTPLKAISAGIGVTLCIEILQLPFYSRVSDVDDLLLNSIGFIIGYLIYLVVRAIRRKTLKETTK